MSDHRHSGHTLTRLTAHVVWVTKYRYHVLEGDIKQRCRDLLVQSPYAYRVPAVEGAVGPGEALEGADVAAAATRIPAPAQALLGAALLGDRLRGVEHRQY